MASISGRIAGILIALALGIAAIGYFTNEKETKRTFELSGKELHDSDIKISAFSRHMKIVKWDWSDSAPDAPDKGDVAVYLDTVYFKNPTRSSILWRDVTVVRGQVFIDFMSAPWYLVDQAEYPEQSTNSKLEYEALVAPPAADDAPTWLIRQFRYVDTFQPDNGRSQAGLRIPYDADLVSLVLDFKALSASKFPTNVACRVRRPEYGSPELVDTACTGDMGTLDSTIFSATFTDLPAGSQVILEWSWPK